MMRWSGKTTEERFWIRVLVGESDDCWIWHGSKNGTAPFQYGRLLHEQRPIGAHRFSYLLHIGEIPEGMEVCHTCDNTLCVNPSHLFVASHADNMRDMVLKGRRNNAGERNRSAKLTAKQVAYIRNQATGRWGEVTSFAREFGVTRSTISKILKHQTWKSA